MWSFFNPRKERKVVVENKKNAIMVVAAILIAIVLISSIILMGNKGPTPSSEFVSYQEISKRFNIEYVKRIVENLSAIGDATGINGEYLGWRLAGSNASHRAAEYVRDEMLRIDLTNVAMERIPLEGWEFRSAWVDIPTIGKIQAVPHAGSPNTSSSPYASHDGSITAEIVNVGNGYKSDYEGKNVSGRIVLICFNKNLWTNTMAFEAQLHGAIAVILSNYDNPDTPYEDRYYGLNDTGIVAMDGEYSLSYLPVLSISGVNGLRLVEVLNESSGPMSVTIFSDILITRQSDGAHGYNVVGYLPGKKWGTPDDRQVIIGDHFDAYWYGSWDNSVGVAATLAIAKAFKEAYEASDTLPNRTLVFIAHDAEEWGQYETYYDWCWGSFYEITELHPEWVGKTVAAIILDDFAAKKHPISFESTLELSYFMETVLRENVEVFPNGYEIFPAVDSYMDHFPYAASGIPAIAISTWDDDYRNFYHTQLDTIDILDMNSVNGTLVACGDMAWRLSNAEVLPYFFNRTAENLRYEMLDSTLHKVSLLYPIYERYNIDEEPNLNRTLQAMGKFVEYAEYASAFVESARDHPISISRQIEINEKLLGIAGIIDSSLISIGVWDDFGYYPYTQSLLDVKYLADAISLIASSSVTLNEVDLAVALLKDWVGISWYYDYMSEENYREQYNISFLDGMISFGTLQNLLPPVEIWDEIDRLTCIVNSGILDTIELADIIDDLEYKLINQGFTNLEKGLTTMWTALEDANNRFTDLLGFE